jgi:hypothetical protein
MVPLFTMPGVWAVAMLALSTLRTRRLAWQRAGSSGGQSIRGAGSGRRTSWYQSAGRRLSWHRTSDSGPHANASSVVGATSHGSAKPVARFSKLVILLAMLLIPLTFGVVGALIAFILSACVGYALVGIYAVTGFHISTWIPFLWSLLQTVLIILGCVCYAMCR